MLRPAVALLTAAFSISILAAGQQPQSASDQNKPAQPGVVVVGPAQPPVDQPQFKPELKAVDLESRPKLSGKTRMQLIGLIDAEFVHVRKYLPLGAKDIAISPEGQVKPGDARLFQMAQTSGAAAKLGDKVQITNVIFHEKSITFEVNGGAKKKSKWYQHVQISGMGGSTAPMDDQGGATGAAITLQFNKHVPEMNAEELKKLISPVLDFSVKTAAEVYVETLPPKIREAIKKHEVLVGMNKDMVVMAMDRPRHKFREKDEQGKEYEEWLYGQAPHDVVFVRFIGDEVTQVKTAKVGGEITVKTQKEVDVKDGVATLASLKASDSPQDVATGPQAQQSAQRPTLKRPGESDDVSVRAPGATGTNDNNAPQQPEPQWGDKKKPDDDGPPASQAPQKPPQ